MEFSVSGRVRVIYENGIQVQFQIKLEIESSGSGKLEPDPN